MESIKRFAVDAREYRQSVNGIYYKQGDTRKMSLRSFDRELSHAINYGAVTALQIALICAQQEYTRDELIGEMQLLMAETYERIRKSGITIPAMKIEDLTSAHYKIEDDSCKKNLTS